MPRALIRRGHALACLTTSFALLVLASCSQSVRPVGIGSLQTGPNGSSPLTSEANGADSTSVPRPPPPNPPPPYDSIQRTRLEQGPALCAARRPDLAQAFVSFELGGNLPPEEVLLLREWVRFAWLQELRNEVVTFQPPACDAHFLCLSGAPEKAELLAGALLRALSAPSQNAFYQARPVALKSTEVWDRSSADWKLNTAARALRADSPGTAQLKYLPKVDNQALLSLVDRYSGMAKATSLPLFVLEKHLSESLRKSTVVIASSRVSVGDWDLLKGEWKAKPEKTEPVATLIAVPEAPLHLEKDAPDVTQAALVWEFGENAPRAPIETALSLLAMRSVGRAGEAARARVRVQPAGGLYSVAALRVDGPHEHVLSTLSQLTEEYDRLISTYGAPSEKEWEAAEFRSPVLTHFEPRCSEEAPRLQPTEAVKLGREALRAAGAPTIVVWGTDTQPEPSE